MNSKNRTSSFVHRPSNNHCTIQDSLGRVTEAGASQISALSPHLSALAIGILLLLTPIAYAELENFQAADVVLGQPSFTSNAANNGAATPSASSMSTPTGIFSDGKRFFCIDRANNRVLIWNKIPATNFTPADVVLGQPDFTSSAVNNGGVSARSLSSPTRIFSDGRKLFVADAGNNRILIWNKIPSANFTPADIVLGQPDFGQNTANNGGVSARSLNAVQGVFSDGKKLFVADRTNNRVLIWNQIPASNFTPADVVLGQPDFTFNTSNNGGISARSMAFVLVIFSDGKRLFVSDFPNNRVLIWNKIPTANFIPADVVLGQPSFSSGVANNGGVSARSSNNPVGIFSTGKKLFIGDALNNRLLIWNKIPTENFAPADVVLGQPDFTSNAANSGGISARSGNGMNHPASDGKRLFVTDQTNNRILIYNLSGSSTIHDPQFEQGKAVVGKVFEDRNGNGIQDKKESGIEGIKIVSDTGIYAITDHDGKYHFPYIETGQHVLKLDPDTLPEGSTITTESPRKVTVTKGILNKVSFGVKLKELNKPNELNQLNDLLKLSITQDTSQKPIKKLGITAELITPKGQSPKNGDSPLIKFTTQCNYYLFVKESMILLYDSNQKPFNTIKLPNPIPLYYELPLRELPKELKTLYYQLLVKDAQGHEDRTSVGRIELK